MKESVEFVKTLGALPNAWSIAIALVLAAPFVFKLLLEAASMSHATREKKLGLLLRYVDQGIEKSPRYAVEQAFQHKYGVLLDFTLIARLMQNVAASRQVQNYIWGRGFLRFDSSTFEFALAKEYNWKVRRFVLVGAFIVAYTIAIISFMSGVVLFANGAWEVGVNSMSLAALMGSCAAVTVFAARASRAARDVVEQQHKTVNVGALGDGDG